MHSLWQSAHETYTLDLCLFSFTQLSILCSENFTAQMHEMYTMIPWVKAKEDENQTHHRGLHKDQGNVGTGPQHQEKANLTAQMGRQLPRYREKHSVIQGVK